MTAVDALEAAALNAWPAFSQVLVDGWLLRGAGGYTRRANSASFLHPVANPAPPQLIERCARHFGALGLPPVFRVVGRPETAAVDAELARRGYRQHDLSLVLTCPAAQLAPPAGDRPALAAPPLDEWLGLFCRLSGRDIATQDAHRRILAAIVPPHLAGALIVAGEAVACGLAVADQGLCGLFDLITGPDQRRRGHGTRLVAGLAAWGSRAGAATVYLQVAAHNTPARRLYERLGFHEAYRYWYRAL